MASMTTDFFSKVLFWRRKGSRPSRDETEQLKITKWENTVNKVKKVVIWDNPIISLFYVVGVNVLYWLLIYIDVKFYGMVFVALLVLSLNQLWNEYFQPVTVANAGSGRESADDSSSSDASGLSLGKINRCCCRGFETIRNGCLQLKRLRREQPGTFCVATCISFLMLSFIGRTVSGVTLLYIMLMAILTVPGIFVHLVPRETVNSIVNAIYSSHKESDKEDDYLPDTNQENLELLRLAGDLQLSHGEDEDSTNDFLLEQISGSTNDTAESSCSKISHYPELPSVDSSLDLLEFETGAKKGDSDESGSNSSSDINFQSKHFNGDTSDEDDFSKGLKIKDLDETLRPSESRDEPPRLLSATGIGINLLSSVGANILSSATKLTGTRSKDRTDRGSSSDTDSFELVSEEDM